MVTLKLKDQIWILGHSYYLAWFLSVISCISFGVVSLDVCLWCCLRGLHSLLYWILHLFLFIKVTLRFEICAYKLIYAYLQYQIKVKRWEVLHGCSFLVKLHLKPNDWFEKYHKMEDKNYNKFLYMKKYNHSDHLVSASDPAKSSAYTNANY